MIVEKVGPDQTVDEGMLHKVSSIFRILECSIAFPLQRRDAPLSADKINKAMVHALQVIET